MTPAPLKEKFEQISTGVRETDDAKRFIPMLESMREAMKDLQDAGFRVSLEVRPASAGWTRAAEPAPYANGTMTIDGLALDFSLGKHANYNEYSILQTYIGSGAFRSQWFTSDKSQVKDVIIGYLLEAKARNDMVSEYNMGQGVSRIAPTKPGPAKLSA